MTEHTPLDKMFNDATEYIVETAPEIIRRVETSNADLLEALKFVVDRLETLRECWGWNEAGLWAGPFVHAAEDKANEAIRKATDHTSGTA